MVTDIVIVQCYHSFRHCYKPFAGLIVIVLENGDCDWGIQHLDSVSRTRSYYVALPVMHVVLVVLHRFK